MSLVTGAPDLAFHHNRSYVRFRQPEVGNFPATPCFAENALLRTGPDYLSTMATSQPSDRVSTVTNPDGIEAPAQHMGACLLEFKHGQSFRC